MDIFSFLARIRIEQPDAAIQSASSTRDSDSARLMNTEKLSTDPTVIRLGGPGEDAHYTETFTALDQQGVSFDPVFCALANHALLELTYQTRFLADPRGSECFLFEGDRNEFPIVTANNNIILCANVVEEDAGRFPLPEWAAATQEVLQHQEGLLVKCRRSELRPALEMNGKSRVGVIVQKIPEQGSHNFPAEYTGLSSFVDEYTTYIFQGSVNRIAKLAKSIAANDDGFECRFKIYRLTGDDCDRAIAVVRGGTQILRFEISNHVSFNAPCLFRAAESTDDGSGGRLVRYRESESIDVKLPFGVFGSAPLTDEIRRNISSDSELVHDVVFIENGYLISVNEPRCSTYLHFSPKGDIFTNCGNEVAVSQQSSIWLQGQVNERGECSSHIRFDKILEVSGTAMPLTFTPHVHEWFSHFIIQCLPRLLLAKELGIKDIKYIVPQGLRKKQFDMLRAAGVGEEQIVRVAPDAGVKADCLVVPRTWRLAFSAFTIGIYDQIVHTLGLTQAPKDKKFLISRESRKTWRNMLNYNAVREGLVQKYGFEVVRPETLSLYDEIDLYRRADIIVGAEGAGLYGAVYSQPGAAVISISDEDYAMPIMGSIASMRDLHLGYVFGESFQSRLDLKRRLGGGHTDYVVSPADVLRAVDAAMQLNRTPS